MALTAFGCDGAKDPVGPDAELESPAASPSSVGATAALVTGDRIAFVSFRNGSSPDVYKMDSQGGSLVPLTPNTTAYDMMPSWSWDNQRIAMVRDRPYGNGTTKDIYVVNRDGSNGHWVRPTPFPFWLDHPVWSPDGSRILLTVLLNDGTYLATMNASTGDVALIAGATGGIRGIQPSYDPTGQRIVYVNNVEKKAILQINADGSGQKVLVSSAQAFSGPAYSPDGKRIVYSRTASTTVNGQTVLSPDIFVKNLVDGTNKRIVASRYYDMEPTWSPDGTRIAFVSSRTGMYQIFTVSANGGTATRITQTTKTEMSPAWTH